MEKAVEKTAVPVAGTLTTETETAAAVKPTVKIPHSKPSAANLVNKGKGAAETSAARGSQPGYMRDTAASKAKRAMKSQKGYGTLQDAKHTISKLAKERGSNSIWARITPTQERWNSRSLIPKSFVIEVNGKKIWVAPNATEHLMELTTPGKKEAFVSLWKPLAKEYVFSHEMILENLHDILQDTLTRAGIEGKQLGKDVLKFVINGWEVSINPSSKGQYAELFHFIKRGK